MVIFGRKGEDSRPVISAPIAQSSPILDQLSIEQGASAVSLRPGWDTIPPRPKTSEGPPQYQFALGQDYLAPPTARKHKKLSHSLSKLNLSSMTSLLSSGIPESNQNVQAFSDEVPAYQQQEGAQSPYDIISAKFNTIVTLIDGERFSGDGADLTSPQDLPLWQQQESAYIAQEVAKGRSKEVKNKTKSTLDFSSGNYFSKVYLYANSKLPRHLPPMKLYLPTFPLLCLAAQYSERVYEKPSGQEKETLVGADWKTGTKAMVVKSAPMDDMNTIVFAIRGTQTFMDWVANFNATPSPPEGFLDDVENLCHTGFLTVARKMINPVAARLRQLIEESPDRSTYSLLITGHSAGGAVASLLYSHMLSTSKSAASELNILTGCFKRIHCVTYGTPPISIFPLTKPDNPALKKSLFYSFLNEGDPITRAHPTYLRSLIELYTHPAPKITYAEPSSSRKHKHTLTSLPSKSSSTLSVDKTRPKHKTSHTAPVPGIAPVWNVPDLIYSNAGRLILLRGMEKKGAEPSKKKKNIEDRMDEGVVAQVITDEQLRDVIWGDPVMHMMKLYSRRIEVLATNAVTGRGG